MTTEDYIKIASVVFAFSGWFKVYYDHQSSKPKVIGRILNVMIGTLKSPNNGHVYQVFFMYPYLLNSRKNSIHILDFEARIKIKGVRGWTRLERGYGMENLRNLTFTSQGGGLIKINGLPDAFIYKKAEPVQQGIPLHGWLPFLSETIIDNEAIIEYMLICTDANSRRHVLKTKAKDFAAIYLLAQIASIDLPSDMIGRSV